jgi:hypothetical protein
LPSFDHDGRHASVITDWSPSINDPAVQTELRAVLNSAVSELPAHYRAVMVLHDVEGLSMAEVADALAISIPTAKTRAHRARLLVRQRLSMLMTSVGAAVDRPARGEYQRRSMRGGRRQYQISTIPEVLAASAGMQPARAVGRRKVTRLWRRKLGPNWNGLKFSSSAVERPASCWPGISRDRQ